MSGFFYVLDDEARLLFVDDDPILREFAQVNLASAAAEVDVAADGVEALEALSRHRYDLLLVDLDMPRMDGFELLAHLRADPATAHLPVVVETGREDVEAIDRAFRAGATAFVTKPLNWRLLTYQLRFTLRAARAEAVLRDRCRSAPLVAA
ncbi:response regulator [Brevundimonas subvibrioides]|uniref:Response regulator receiver protein n=1 Tax=Brevundimonas subvibrioides (strain ATCC 15264 / DSM 4735 / LMG 14903 / NBRC 16000 / CB 81) TaxID=633149 RepID=D9QJ30_BRESC|nr:response regulator [Brevundimonas subvibrioides]ADK99554.1 response regulator receiver protein [Brevundimonas subvibrioides ATCC 15264]